MNDNLNFIQESIIRDMSEGVMTIGFDGIITSVNPAAADILECEADSLEGKSFARCFFEYEENDAFNQTILDAVYDSSATHENIVQYFTGKRTKHLHVTTSFLHNAEKKIGIIVVIGDITELTELRDAVKAMERIKALNNQLELRNRLLNETFGRFLSDEIVRQLLETPDGLMLGGKKRSLTVMMSDLRGFTAMSERMDAQSLISMLNHYLGEMTYVIQKNNGTIIEFIGDGIMAVFGAPLASDKHADDAVAAAVEMQSRMKDINLWNEERGYPLLQMGIGINSGDVIVGNIGSEKRTKYGVVGSNVNLCGRIESYTVGGQILISPETRNLMKSESEVVREMLISPKGVTEPIVISQVCAVGEPYNVSCGEYEETLTKVDNAVPVDFLIISGKHCENPSVSGFITMVSRMGAVLETSADADIYDNLRIDISGGMLFCKITERVENGFKLRFTSLPENFDKWYKDIKERS